MERREREKEKKEREEMIEAKPMFPVSLTIYTQTWIVHL